MAIPGIGSTGPGGIDFSAKGYPMSREIRTEGGVLGMGGTRHEVVLFENGEIWDFSDDGDVKYVDTDPRVLATWKAKQPPQVNPTSQWSIQTKPDGTKVSVNEMTGETKPLEGFGPEPSPQLPLHYYGDDKSGRFAYDPNTRTSQTIAEGKAETITDDDGNIWKKEPVTGNYINIGNLPLTESQRRKRAYEDAQLANLGAGNALARDRFAWDQAKEVENRRHEIEKQRQADEAAMERQRLTEQANLFDTVTKNWRELLPRRVPPGMEYWPGAEPEGPLSVLYKQAGAQYNPVAGRVVPTSYNDEDMWKKALGMVGGK